jgi:RNA polymerase sigma factor (sigma-70 family)
MLTTGRLRIESNCMNGGGASSLTELVADALAGSEIAWHELVRRLERVVWKSVNLVTTDDDVRNDAFAATWLRFAERLHTIREPEKLPGWLVTTATNEVRLILRSRGRREVLVDTAVSSNLFESILGADPDAFGVDAEFVRYEAASAVRLAFSQLDVECRMILSVLVMDEDISYRQASAVLQRPIGALGPSRRRCLEKLRLTPAMARILEEHGRA